MKFHFPSFLLGYGAGVATVMLGDRLRPILVELTTAAYELADSLAARVAMAREHIDDMVAEASTRARKQRPAGRRRSHA